MITFMRNFQDLPVLMGELFGMIGGFCDFDFDNRRKVEQLGGIDLAFNITRKHYFPQTVLGLQCLASTQCWPAENHARMKRNGYVSWTPQQMRDFPTEIGIRGEGIYVMGYCFGGEADSDASMVENGMIEEIVSSLRDAPHAQLDVLATTDRVYYYGMGLLATLGHESPQYRDRAVRAGAVEQVAAAMLDHVRNKAEANSAMRIFNLHELDVLQRGCDALRAFSTDSPDGSVRLAAVQGELHAALLSPSARVVAPQVCRTLLA